MEIEFYRIKGYPNNLWFTDTSGVAVVEWALEQGITYSTEISFGGKFGIIPDDANRVMFELRWGDKYKTSYGMFNDDVDWDEY